MQISTLLQCIQARHISRDMLAIHFPDDEHGKRTYKFAKINGQAKYAVEGAENREMGPRGDGGYKVSCMSYLRGDLVADQRS